MSGRIEVVIILMLMSQLFNAFGIFCHLVWHECEDKRRREEQQSKDRGERQ